MHIPPDVVICDLEFPARSGLTALRELRQKRVKVSFVMISLDAGKPMLTGMGSRLCRPRGPGPPPCACGTRNNRRRKVRGCRLKSDRTDPQTSPVDHAFPIVLHAPGTPPQADPTALQAILNLTFLVDTCQK